MDLKPARPALYEAGARRGFNVKTATHQQMRSLVCAQCHTEYYFQKDNHNHLTFPQDKGLTCEDAEAYYDSIGFYDYIHPLSKAKILKAQHPDYEMSLQGIHAQRGVSCADCHMPYLQEGGVKYTDHHIMSPLANIDRTCQTCHRQDAETLRQNVIERQKKVYDFAIKVDNELARAHLYAEFAWKHGATEPQMEKALNHIRKSQWRWDYAMAGHGSAFHAPQEMMRLLADAMTYAKDAQLECQRVAAQHGWTKDIPVPDFSTKEKAQRYIGLDMEKLKNRKQQFLNKVVPQCSRRRARTNASSPTPIKPFAGQKPANHKIIKRKRRRITPYNPPFSYFCNHQPIVKPQPNSNYRYVETTVEPERSFDIGLGLLAVGAACKLGTGPVPGRSSPGPSTW
jgi:nitrite reductase (cytochrome c-552)